MFDFNNKTIMVTGCCGTVGSEIIKEIYEDEKYINTRIIGIDNNESGVFFLDENYKDDSRFNFYVADILNEQLLYDLTSDVSAIIHTAACKHVILSEISPEHAIKTNIDGLQNIISVASKNNIEKVIFTSSDKAVNPTNVMGTTKLLGEKIITAASEARKSSSRSTIYSSTRFGNVLGSNGSVVSIFMDQI